MNSGSAAKQTRRQTLHVSRLRRAIYALIHSNALIVGVITKPAPTNAHSGGINSIESGTKRNMSRSVKTESNQITLWRATSSKYDFEKPQYSFAKCSQESPHSQHYPRDSVTL